MHACKCEQQSVYFICVLFVQPKCSDTVQECFEPLRKCILTTSTNVLCVCLCALLILMCVAGEWVYCRLCVCVFVNVYLLEYVIALVVRIHCTQLLVKFDIQRSRALPKKQKHRHSWIWSFRQSVFGHYITIKNFMKKWYLLVIKVSQTCRRNRN